MKHFRFFLFFLLVITAVLFAGCALPWQPVSYTVVSEHNSNVSSAENTVYQAANYSELRACLLDMIDAYQSSGTIQVSANYDGSLTAELNDAVYDVWKNDPLGAYSVDYITTDTTKLLNHIEVQVDILYRRSQAEINSIRYVRGVGGLTTAIQEALEAYEPKLILKVSALTELPNCSAIVNDYCAGHLETVMEVPSVTFTAAPDSGPLRIIEINFEYSNSPSSLKTMESSVTAALDSAVGYVSYRETPEEKAALLYTFLAERFDYVSGTTNTPMFSMLCTGILNSETIAKAYTIVCNRAGIDCVTVNGYLNGEPYYWNILTLNGSSRHIDLYQAILAELRSPQIRLDDEMVGYSWDHTAYPTCEELAPVSNPAADKTDIDSKPTVDETPAENVPESESPSETDKEPNDNPDSGEDNPTESGSENSDTPPETGNPDENSEAESVSSSDTEQP